MFWSKIAVTLLVCYQWICMIDWGGVTGKQELIRPLHSCWKSHLSKRFNQPHFDIDVNVVIKKIKLKCFKFHICNWGTFPQTQHMAHWKPMCIKPHDTFTQTSTQPAEWNSQHHVDGAWPLLHTSPSFSLTDNRHISKKSQLKQQKMTK